MGGQWKLTVAVGVFGRVEHLEGPSEVQGVKPLMEGEQHLDGLDLVFRNCTHFAGIEQMCDGE